MIEDKTSIQAQPKAASTSNELTQNLPFSPNPALLYRPGNPLNILHPSKYHPMPLGLSLPNPHLNSVPNPLPKGLHQHSTARVKKELTSKLKSKESGSGGMVNYLRIPYFGNFTFLFIGKQRNVSTPETYFVECIL